MADEPLADAFTDEEKKHCLTQGLPLRFASPTADQPELPSHRAARTIQASWLEDLSTGPEATVKVAILLEHAVIEGPLRLRYATFLQEVAITRCEFTGPFDLSYARFARAVSLAGCSFRGSVRFNAVTTTFDLNVDEATFADRFTFDDGRIGGIFLARGAAFGPASFRRLTVDKAALFAPSPRHLTILKSPRPAKFTAEALFTDAHIRGVISFEGARFDGPASFERLKAESRADFGSTTVAGSIFVTEFNDTVTFLDARILGTANFSGVTFGKTATFTRARMRGSALFRSIQISGRTAVTTFRGSLVMAGASIDRVVNFDGVTFAGPVSFERLRVGDVALFRRASLEGESVPIEFRAQADFRGMRVNGTAEFDGAQFLDETIFTNVQMKRGAFFRDCAVSGPIGFWDSEVGLALFIGARFNGSKSAFDRLRVNGPARFDRAQFASPASFNGIRVGGEASFDGAEFAEVSFRSAHIMGGAEFRRAVFHGDASFEGLATGSHAVFRGARFEREARFLDAAVEGSLDCDAVEFLGPVNMMRMQVEGDATFRPAGTGEAAVEAQAVWFQCGTSFSGAHLKGDVSFQQARFSGPADFQRISVGGTAVFHDAVFSEQADFREARFRTVLFRDEVTDVPGDGRTQFGGRVELDGFTCTRIRVAWREMFAGEPSYDRNAYAVVERAFRLAGHDREADDVYVAQRQRETQRVWRAAWHCVKGRRVRGASQILAALWHMGDWILTGYGVRPYAILIPIVLAVLPGIVLFSQEGAVRPKPPATSALATPASGAPAHPNRLSFLEALSFCVDLSTSTEDPPSGSRWAPTADPVPVPWLNSAGVTFAGYARFQRLMVRLLGLVATAVVTGKIARRRSPLSGGSAAE